ncbi:hypothetical protein Cfla_1231 [Cellulomonas flavigena DSM 20109]|uniref:Uncharacterized protein n=1 Tax=Cellulomonas flavigena (strain ATCC 482 / DSM 20109 / BCRC 11376 / JCM 18109 / NBRC 3775 / NCIMB 8073 / NRS 134) TaxID=446466 RepID=D5UBN7_CELFN|nr:hypothetical protein [Cellulomonas flavigena]ADG74132.1 hypothetical protein Cfla_1231 [Cellulomonas flavigena DSM 20109]
MSDFRAQRMPSPDGQGIAKSRWERAWSAYTKAVRPLTDPLAEPLRPLILPIARGATFDLVGFWFVWHTAGGFEGMQSQLGMSRSAVYRRISAFRKVFGEHPDVYRFPGVTIDLDTVIHETAGDTPKP